MKVKAIGASTTRRGFVGGAAATVASVAIGGPLGAGTAPCGARLHVAAADRARALAGGSAQALTLLSPVGSGSNLAPVIEAFQQMSGVAVQLVERPVDDIGAELILNHLLAGPGYDLALPPTFTLPDLAAEGVIRPITDLAARHEPADWRSSALYPVGDSFDGELFGFQTDGDVYMMFYNKRWLRDRGMSARYEDRHGTALRIPRTWRELDRQMAFFHRPELDQYGGALFRTPSYLAWEWWLRFHAKGAWPLSVGMKPQIASDAGVEALEDMIRATQWLYPMARSAGLFENWELYGKGNVYCNIGWGGSQKYLNGPRSAIAGQMEYALPPIDNQDAGVDGMAYFNWGWNYVVPSAAALPELSYLFALFAVTSEISTRSVRASDGFFDPFRPEHYRDPQIEKTYSPDFLKVHQLAMNAAIPDFYLRNRKDYFAELGRGIDLALSRETTPKEALERVADKWVLLNHRAGFDAQSRRWSALRRSYPPQIRQYLDRSAT